MSRFPRPERRDYAAFGAAALCLLVAYVVVPSPLVQYTAWLVVFTIWMVWFVLVAVKVIPVIDR